MSNGILCFLFADEVEKGCVMSQGRLPRNFSR